MATFKVHLTKEQWARVCENDEEIAGQLVLQQPELAKELGYELETPRVKRVKTAASESPSETT